MVWWLPLAGSRGHFPGRARLRDMVTASGTFDLDGETTVNRLGFGAMRLCGDDIIGPPDDEERARDVVRRAVELGIDLIDTADAYGPGTSERLLREAFAADPTQPADVVIATKAGTLRNADGDWLAHGDPDYVRNQALVCCDRLGVDAIDLFQLHGPDDDVPFEETIAAFAELKDDGLVRHVGVSNVSLDQLELARDHVEVATVQNHYNVKTRDTPRVNGDGRRVLAACEEYQIGFIPYFPLAAGDLSDVDGIEEIAAAHDATPYQVALAWLLDRSEVMLPIPGTSSLAHLEDNVAAAELELTDAEHTRLDG